MIYLNNKKSIKSLAIFIFLISGILFSKNTSAQIGVPISTQLDFQSIMNFQKNFTFDRIAVMAAKQVLHQITVSVVNWINSGFQGSPLFLTNPGGFFLDVADQITGAFIATNGPLSSLCSPFAIDIRLGLALSQTTFATQRYRCTLGEIIRVQKGGPDIIVNGQVVRSSQGSMRGFLGGDFNQGGWPAFITLTTEPQNNPYAAFQRAEAELNHRIISGQNVIKADLQMGMGFMSWSDCKDLPQGTGEFINDPSIKQKINKDKSITYQTCEVKTPGSVISGSLEKNLNVPVTELELADDINAVLNALFNQLTSRLIGGGLGSLSSPSGSESAFTQQVTNSINAEQSQQTLDGLQSTVISAMGEVDSSLAFYTKSINALTETERRLNAAKSCMVPKASRVEYFGNRISEIDLAINSYIKTTLADLNNKKKSAEEVKSKLTDISISLAGTGSASNINAQLAEYNRLTQSDALYIHQRHGGAAAKYNEIEDFAKTQNARADKYLKECEFIP